MKKPRRDHSGDRPRPRPQEKKEETKTAEEVAAEAAQEAEKKRKYAEKLDALKKKIQTSKGEAAQGNGDSPASCSSPQPPTSTNAQSTNNLDGAQHASQSEKNKSKTKKPKVLGADFKVTAPMKGMTSQTTSTNAPSRPIPYANAKFQGIKLNKSANKSLKPDPSVPMRKGPAGFGDEAPVARKKFVPLPEMTADNMDVQEGDEDSDAIQDEDEEMAGHLAAADRRSRAAMASSAQETAPPTNGQVGSVSMTASQATGESEDVDPLDAYMVDIENEVRDAPKLKQRQHVPQVYLPDDHDVTFDAIGDQFDNLDHAKKNSKKKELPPVDHSKIDYPDFRKNFYIESTELSEMTEDEVQLARLNGNVKVKGNSPPKPINDWSQGGFNTTVLEILRDRKYVKPTPIQREALPAILSGRDMVGVAQTGSGKTVAFLLPMLRHVKDQPPIANGDGPIAVILAPTRELASQIHKECKTYLAAYQLRAVAAYGGSDLKANIADMKRGTEILVATPGRFIELLAANNGRVTNLHRVTYLVLDEADRMFDMGFEPQIMKIMNNIRPDRQTVLFSATLPLSIAGLARSKLKNALEITIGSRSVVASDISQSIEVRGEETRFTRLLQILGETYFEDSVNARTLIFVERQEAADDLFLQLTKRQYTCVTIHGGREQIDREDSIKDFKAGKVNIMIATSVAARGLDVQELKLVINYDPPNHLEDYVHRAGRTGRAGNKGNAITFVSEDQCKHAPFLIKALKDSKHDVPEPLKNLQELFNKRIEEGKEKRLDNARQGFAGRGVERFAAQREKERAREGQAYDNEGNAVEEEADDKEKAKNAEAVDQAIAKAKGIGNVAKEGEGDSHANSHKAAPESEQQESKTEGLQDENLQNKLVEAMEVKKHVREPEPDTSKLSGYEKAMRARQKANQALGASGKCSSQPVRRRLVLTITMKAPLGRVPQLTTADQTRASTTHVWKSTISRKKRAGPSRTAAMSAVSSIPPASQSPTRARTSLPVRPSPRASRRSISSWRETPRCR